MMRRNSNAKEKSGMKSSERSRRGLAASLLVGLGLVIGGCAAAPQGGGAAAAPVAGPEKAAAGYKYVCGCGPQCDCNTTADKLGSGTCGKPLTYMKVVREDSNYFWVCQGGAKELSKNDPFKCADGKPVQAVVKKGRYVCNCGPECTCGMASQKNGNCVCGKPMKAAP